MLRPTGPRRQSNPQPSEFEAALRHTEPLLAATNVTVPSGEERQPVSITGKPEVPVFDPDRKVMWTVDGRAVRFDLSDLLAKPQVASTSTTALNSTNAVVHSMGSTLCMLARSTDSPSQFLFSADRAGTYSVAITVSSIDIEPWARRSSAAAIPASPPLVAGPGINITDDPDGRKRVAVTNPRPQAGRDLSAADKFAQRAPDPDREWRLEAIQKSDPHVVQMEYNARTRTYQGTFPMSADGAVTGRLDYVLTHTSGNVDAGKFVVTTYPDDPSRTLANLFDAGTVDALILQSGGSAEAAVTDRKFTADVIKDTRNTNTLAFVSKTAQVHNPSPMGTDGDTAYVRINFRLTDGVVTGWNRDSSKDVDGAELRAARSGIVPASLVIVQNRVLLVGDRYSGNVYGFKDGHRFPGADITTGIDFSAVNGMAYNRTGNKLAITQGGYSETIKVFKLKKPGTAAQELGEETNDTISGDKLVAGVPFALWCMAWHDNEDEDLWVIDRKGFARVFRGGNHVGSKDKKLPGTEQVYAATLVGDVLIYGGGGAAVYAYNVVTDERVPELELTGSQVRAGLSGFGLLCAEYDPAVEILYLGGWGVHLAAFTPSKAVTAYPEASLHGYRTMSKERLQAETLDAPAGDAERAFTVVVSEQQPAAAARLKTLRFVEDNTNQSRYEVEEPFTGITSIVFDARAGDEQYKYQVWMRSIDAQGDGIPEVIKVGSVEYSLGASSLGGGAVAAFVTTSAVASAARVSDGTLSRQIDLRYASGSWANAATEPRTLTNTQLKRALGAGADPVAQEGNTERWPLAKVPIVKMTQAQYDAATAAGTIAQDILYVIVG